MVITNTVITIKSYDLLIILLEFKNVRLILYLATVIIYLNVY